MDRWALKYLDAEFLCVSCAGPTLASQFVRELQLRHCKVAILPPRSQPRWGQLGCNGFIVLDSQHHVVAKATSPWLQAKDLAFQHVEALLDALVAGVAPPSVCPGQLVRLHGLQKNQRLNGQKGVCIRGLGTDGRCEIRLRSARKSVSVNGANLRMLHQAEKDDEDHFEDALAALAERGEQHDRSADDAEPGFKLPRTDS
jgi:DUF971 family protein